MQCLFLTHPEVVVEPDSPVTAWGLSALGRSRAEAFAGSGLLSGTELLISSMEAKAVETAAILGQALGLPVVQDEALGENDRSATGFVPPADFEQAADAFFARPVESFRGWETAAAAQARIVGAVRRLLEEYAGKRVAFVAHGAVGTLLLCDLMGVPISRQHDQPRQGCWFAFDPDTWTTEGTWQEMAGS